MEMKKPRNIQYNIIKSAKNDSKNDSTRGKKKGYRAKTIKSNFQFSKITYSQIALTPKTKRFWMNE